MGDQTSLGRAERRGLRECEAQDNSLVLRANIQTENVGIARQELRTVPKERIVVSLSQNANAVVVAQR